MSEFRPRPHEHSSRWRRALARWAAADAAGDPAAGALAEGDGDPVHDPESIAAARDREVVTLCGSLHTVTLRPRGGVPALEAELADDTGRLTLVFLGRRRITGVTPGRGMRVTGRIGLHNGVRIMYNPRYELLPVDPDRVFT